MAGVVTYYSYDMGLPSVFPVPILLAELPLTGVTFGSRLNTPGQFTGSLLLQDPRVRALDPWDATRPSRTFLIVDIDGTIVWGGPIWTRSHDSTSHVVTISGSEAWSYFQYRVQAQDYTLPPTNNAFSGNAPTYWSVNPVDMASAAAQVVLDACSSSGSIFPGFVTLTPGTENSGAIYIAESAPSTELIAQSFPYSQLQTVDSIVTTLAQSGYGTGFDFGIDWVWSTVSGSTPIPTLNISFPRRGRIAGSTGLAIDSGGTGISYLWPEDGTAGSNVVYASSSASGTSAVASDPTPLENGYPVLETVTSFTNIVDLAALVAAGSDDLGATEWPVASPTFTMPLTGDPAIGDFIMGDDVRIIMQPDERFPSGFDVYMRMAANDVKIAEEGVSTMAVTLQTTPGLAPLPQLPL